MNGKLLTLSEVAELTRLPEATLRWFRHCCKGPKSGKLGRRVMYRESDVEEWIDAQFKSDAESGVAWTTASRRRSADRNRYR